MCFFIISVQIFAWDVYRFFRWWDCKYPHIPICRKHVKGYLGIKVWKESSSNLFFQKISRWEGQATSKSFLVFWICDTMIQQIGMFCGNFLRTKIYKVIRGNTLGLITAKIWYFTQANTKTFQSGCLLNPKKHVEPFFQVQVLAVLKPSTSNDKNFRSERLRSPVAIS